MSRTTSFNVGNRGFWALDDAFGVWLAYMIEEITRHEAEPWQAKLAGASSSEFPSLFPSGSFRIGE